MALFKIIAGIGEDAQGIPLSGATVRHAIDDTAARISKVCGGVTIIEGQGAWLNQIGTLIKEPSAIFETYGQNDGNTINAMRGIAKELRFALRQYSVCFIVNHEIEFITN
jgi:hypothetical protein